MSCGQMRVFLCFRSMLTISLKPISMRRNQEPIVRVVPALEEFVVVHGVVHAVVLVARTGLAEVHAAQLRCSAATVVASAPQTQIA